MNRTFQAKVDSGYWMIIAVSSLFLFYCFWEHLLWGTIIGGAAVIFEIEMLVHTRYSVWSAGILRIESGRFVRNREISVGTISRVRRLRSWCLFKPALSSDCLKIEYEEGGRKKNVCISPRNCTDFVRCLVKLNPHIQSDISDARMN